MRIRSLLISVTILAAGLTGATSAAHAATSVVGPIKPVANGATFTGLSESTAIGTGVGALVCQSATIGGTFTTTLGSPRAVARLTELDLATCADGTSSNTDECALAPPPATATFAAGFPEATVSLDGPYFRCHQAGSGTPGNACYLRAPSNNSLFSTGTSTLLFRSTLDHTVPAGATDDVGGSCGSFTSFQVNFAALKTSGTNVVATTPTPGTTAIGVVSKAASGTTFTGGIEGTAIGVLSGSVLSCEDGAIGGTITNADASPSATGTLTSLTLTSCTDTLPSVNLDECSLATPQPTITFTGAYPDATLSLDNQYLRCHNAGSGSPGTACYFGAPTNDNAYRNTTSTLVYRASLTHTVPTGASGDLGGSCPSTNNLNIWFDDIRVSATTRLGITGG